MKQLITILLTLFTLISYSQTELDQEIFKVVNEYRISNGLTPWIWSQETFVACEFHNSYQTKIKNIKHHEKIKHKFKHQKQKRINTSYTAKEKIQMHEYGYMFFFLRLLPD